MNIPDFIWIGLLAVGIVIFVTEFQIDITIIHKNPEESKRKLKKTKEK